MRGNSIGISLFLDALRLVCLVCIYIYKVILYIYIYRCVLVRLQLQVIAYHSLQTSVEKVEFWIPGIYDSI